MFSFIFNWFQEYQFNSYLKSIHLPKPVIKHILLHMVYKNTSLITNIRLLCKWTSIDADFKRICHYYTAQQLATRVYIYTDHMVNIRSWVTNIRIYGHYNNNSICFEEPLRHITNINISACRIIFQKRKRQICSRKNCTCDPYNVDHILTYNIPQSASYTGRIDVVYSTLPPDINTYNRIIK